MSILSAYVRENWSYSVDDLRSLFSFNTTIYETDDDADKDLKKYIKELLSRNILKEEKQSSVKEADIEFENYDDTDLTRSNKQYKFKFVGMVICQSRIAYIYPKYIGESNRLPDHEPKTEMAQVIQVIEKYSREKAKQDIHEINLFAEENDNGKINTLSVMLYILEDYTANGAFENEETIIEVNGNNDILWQKTIDETYPIIADNRPFYTKMYTRRNISDDMDYFKRLHEYVVTKCSYEVDAAGLTDFFSLPYADISDDEEETFGDTGYILDKLDMAVSETFDDRKLSVLKALRLYFKSSKILLGDTEIQLIGTRSFNLIWEEVCARVFQSQKGDKRTRHPNVTEIQPLIDYTEINKNFIKKPPLLAELIKQPVWKKYKKDTPGIPKDTFNPDFLRFEEKAAGDNYIFYILDAKYYCPVWTDTSILGQPGVEDIAKQYLYHLAYKEILDQYRVTEVKNYFLMPKRDSDPELPGFVKLDILKDLGLGVIEIRMIPPVLMFDHYLKNGHMNLTELH